MLKNCEACWIGNSKSKADKPVQCKWISLKNNTIKILGTHFSYDKILEKKTNFYNLRTECRTILNLWKQRWLSLAGKIQTFKSLIASKPVYIATMKGIPQEVLDDLKSIHNEFIWDGKRAKIKHSTLIGKYEEGGFKDVDLQSKFTSCKAIWIRKMVNNMNFHPWVAVAIIILKDFGGANIFHTNLSLSPRMQTYLQNIPLFYKDLIITWQTL